MLSLTCYVISYKALPSWALFPTPSATMGTEWSLGAIQVCIPDHPHSGLLSSLKKVSSDTCYHTDKPWERYAKRNRPGTKRETLHNLLMKVFKEAKLRDRKQRGRCQGLGAGGRGRWCWIRFARWKNSKDLLHNQVSKIHVFKWLRWPCVCVFTTIQWIGKVTLR